MKENFIKMEESENDSDIIMKDETKNSNEFIKKEKLPTKYTSKRKSTDVKKTFPGTQKQSIRKFNFDYFDNPFNKDLNDKNKVNKYEIIEMSNDDKRLMDFYNYLKNDNELKKNDTKKFKYDDKIITLTLIGRSRYLIFLIDEKGFEIFDEAREIMFVDKILKKIIKRFIYNSDILSSTLTELGFISYYVKSSNDIIIKDNNIFDSLKEKESDSTSSEVSLDPYKIFIDKKIKYIYNENQRPILNEKNFKSKYKLFPNRLRDLNLNSKYYYEYPDNLFFDSKLGYKIAFDNLINFRQSRISKILYLYGPNRSSKTTFLLYMINYYCFSAAKFLYFNVDYLEKNDLIQRKRIIYYELLYFCKDIKEMKEIENKKIFQKAVDATNIMEFIYLILQALFDVIYNSNDDNNKSNNGNNRNNGNKSNYFIAIRMIIIDNIYSNDENTLNYLNKIINFINQKDWYIKLIICGRGPYFNQKFFEFYKDFHVYTNDDNLKGVEIPEFLYIYYGDNNRIHDIMNEKQIKENEKIDVSHLEKVVSNKIYSFYELYFSEELDKKTFSYDTIIDNRDYLIKFPLEYFEIKKIKYELKFNFYNTSYKQYFKEKIGFEIEKGTLTNLLKRNDYPRTFFGICFEKLITLLLMHNKLNLYNLNFQKSNIKEIKEISYLKKDEYNGPSFMDININEPILIVQENFFGPLYDLLIITKRNNYYYSDFVQIGVDKTDSQIKDITNDLASKYDTYKTNIFKAFGIQSNFISVLFIFDYNTQKDKNFLTGCKICKNKRLNFYLFSLRDCSLVELSENNELKIFVTQYSPETISNVNEINKSYNDSRKNKKKHKNNGNNNCAKITDFFG